MAIPEIITWDWKEQPPWSRVLDALQRTYTDGPQIFSVETHSDHHAIVIAERTVTPESAQEWYQEHLNG